MFIWVGTYVRSLKLALVQFESQLQDVAKNLEKTIRFIGQAAEEKADMIVFPELFLTGYNPGLVGKDFFKQAENVQNKQSILTVLSQKAKEANIHLIIPMATYKDAPGVIYNSSVVINRKGEISGVYDKTHLWSDERVYFKEGEDYPVFELDHCKIGLMMCYDGGFPEVSRILALKGAELIICPSAFRVQDKDMWDIYFKARALENTCFVVGVNRVGTEEDLHMFGNNKVANPRGSIILDAPVDIEGMQIIDINIDEVLLYREEIPFLRDRKQGYSL
ncbi:hypothetical protein EWH99_08190 [Sporolactobacillus sp. THM7-7]|nr:hypothetical protein EWH99_08190 [Sporolactobacillus sp. THM7-7]